MNDSQLDSVLTFYGFKVAKRSDRVANAIMFIGVVACTFYYAVVLCAYFAPPRLESGIGDTFTSLLIFWAGIFIIVSLGGFGIIYTMDLGGRVFGKKRTGKYLASASSAGIALALVSVAHSLGLPKVVDGAVFGARDKIVAFMSLAFRTIARFIDGER